MVMILVRMASECKMFSYHLKNFKADTMNNSHIKIRFLPFFIFLLIGCNFSYADIINLTCQVHGKFSFLSKYGGDDESIGPETISVTIKSDPKYIDIEITGTRRFSVSAFGFKRNEISGQQSDTGYSATEDNTFFRINSKSSATDTKIELNRVTGLIAVHDYQESPYGRGTTTYSGLCALAKNQKF